MKESNYEEGQVSFEPILNIHTPPSLFLRPIFFLSPLKLIRLKKTFVRWKKYLWKGICPSHVSPPPELRLTFPVELSMSHHMLK